MIKKVVIVSVMCMYFQMHCMYRATIHVQFFPGSAFNSMSIDDETTVRNVKTNFNIDSAQNLCVYSSKDSRFMYTCPSCPLENDATIKDIIDKYSSVSFIVTGY